MRLVIKVGTQVIYGKFALNRTRLDQIISDIAALIKHGHEVVLLFDGAGTEWIAEWSKPDSTDKLAPMYKELREAGVTNVICDFCANAFQVKENLEENKAPLTAEYKGHPSIAKFADKGYQIIIL